MTPKFAFGWVRRPNLPPPLKEMFNLASAANSRRTRWNSSQSCFISDRFYSHVEAEAVCPHSQQLQPDLITASMRWKGRLFFLCQPKSQVLRVRLEDWSAVALSVRFFQYTHTLKYTHTHSHIFSKTHHLHWAGGPWCSLGVVSPHPPSLLITSPSLPCSLTEVQFWSSDSLINLNCKSFFLQRVSSPSLIYVSK